MSRQGFVHPGLMLVVVTVLSAALATPAVAADLAGTSWSLHGSMTVKAKMGRYVERQTTDAVSYVEFANGSCTLDTGDGVVLPCTWTSPNQRRVRLTINAEPLRAALEQALEDEFGPGLSVSLSAKPVNGRIGRNMSSLRLPMRFTGTVTGAVLPQTMKLWVKTTQNGLRVTLAPAERERSGASTQIAVVVQRVLEQSPR